MVISTSISGWAMRPSTCSTISRLSCSGFPSTRPSPTSRGAPTSSVHLLRAGFVLDLQQGAVIRIDAEAAREIALDAAPRIIGRPATVVGAEEIQSDQWTVGRLRRERPLYRIAFDDPERTNIYVSGS